jgi:hypothetical protein
MQPDVLFQNLPERDLRLRLEDLEKRLAATPSFKTVERRVLQIQINNLKNGIRADHDAVGIPRPPKLGLKKYAGAELGGIGGRGGVAAAEDAALARAQFTAHFGVVPVTDSMKRGLDRIREGFERARYTLSRNGHDALARQVDWFETAYTQAYLKSEMLPQALKIAKRAADAGYYIVFAGERGRKLEHRISIQPRESVSLDDLDCKSGGCLKPLLPKLKDAFGALQAQFGNVADYCGDSVDYERGRELRKDFLAGRQRIIYTAYGAGNVPLCDADYTELGIVGGAKPRVSIFLAPPRSAHLVIDAALLTWRASAKSDVHAVFLSTDSSHDTELLQQKVGPLLRAIGATVVGERISVIEQLSAMTEGARETALEAALAFAEGKVQKVEATMYQIRSKSQKLSIDDWSQIDFPPAESAKRKQCNTAKELLDSEVRDQYLATFGMKPHSSDEGASSVAAESTPGAVPDNAPMQALDAPNSETAPASTNGEMAEKGMLRLRESMRNADLIAVALVAMLISILGFLITHNAPAGLFKTFGRWSLADAVGLLSLSALAIAAGMMLAVLYPKRRSVEDESRVLDAMTKPENSLFLPARVASALQEDFYEMTVACAAKYRTLRLGFWVGVVAALLSLLFLILSKRPHPRFYPY